MSRRKYYVVIALALAIVLTGLLTAVIAQVAGADVGRNILRMARERKTGQKVVKPARETTTAEEPRVEKTVKPVTPKTAEPVTTVTAVASGDEILNLLPENCLVCIRLNNLDATLGAVDQYITGVSPLPVSVAALAKMKLGEIIADPLLEGLDTQGDFAIFGSFASDGSAAGQMPEMQMGMLLPVKPSQFKADTPNTTLVSPNYALLQPDSEQIREAIKANMLKSSLVRQLDRAQISQAKSSPIWGYVNVEKAVELFGPLAFAQIDAAMDQIPQAPAEPGQPEGIAETNKKMAGMYVDFLKTYATQLKSLSLNVTPEPGVMNLKVTLSAKRGSDLAQLLVRDPSMKSGYKLAGLLDEPAAVNVVFKTNKQLVARLNEVFMDMFGEILGELMPAGQVDAWKTLAADNSRNMGDEMAFSFSLAPGMPPVAIKEIIRLEDPQAMMSTMDKSMAMVNEMYKSMQLPLTIGVAPDGERYKGADIYSLTLDMQAPPHATPEEKQMMEAMFQQGFNCKFATTRDLMLVVVAENAQDDIRRLIDQTMASTPPRPTGDLALALSAIPNAAETDFVASVNVIRLLSGVGEMMSAMPVPAGQMMGEMFKQLDVPAESCICLAGTVENGSATLQVAVPKQHLLEIVSVAMKLQEGIQVGAGASASTEDSDFSFDMGQAEGAENTVTLKISGVPDDAAEDAITDRLLDIAIAGTSMSWDKVGDVLTVELSPVKDPKAFADKIDFGTVTEIKEKTITIRYGK